MTQESALPWVLEPPHHGYPVPPAPLAHWPSVQDLVNIACDIQPDIGDEAPDRALGPWSDVLDRTQPAHRRLLRHAVAVYGLSCASSETASAVRRFLNNGAQKKLPTREALSSVLRTPMGLWTVESASGCHWILRDMIDIEPAWTPQRPVNLDGLASVSTKGIEIGDTVCARILPAPGEDIAVVGFYVKGAPNEDELTRWRQQVLTRHHAERTNGSIGCAVSRHGHLLVRHLHRWAWHDA